MTRTGYAAEVTVTDGQRSASLGGVTVRNRRLVLLWLRGQALRLANGHGNGGGGGGGGGGRHGHGHRHGFMRAAVDSLPPPRANDVRPAVFHGSDAPEELRFWATDGRHQDDAIRALEAGFPLLFTVVDPAVGLSLTLAGWRGSPADL
ncbi:hypothetical protein [Streptomyces sp. NPDC048142]|uniref:hypothetical protein n=1 Tax=Streptomyces sp. NPDC048142 TaxID=3365501 RepID=UPI00371D686C